jgi:hypothetical protein
LFKKQALVSRILVNRDGGILPGLEIESAASMGKVLVPCNVIVSAMKTIYFLRLLHFFQSLSNPLFLGLRKLKLDLQVFRKFVQIQGGKKIDRRNT